MFNSEQKVPKNILFDFISYQNISNKIFLTLIHMKQNTMNKGSKKYKSTILDKLVEKSFSILIEKNKSFEQQPICHYFAILLQH